MNWAEACNKKTVIVGIYVSHYWMFYMLFRCSFYLIMVNLIFQIYIEVYVKNSRHRL